MADTPTPNAPVEPSPDALTFARNLSHHPSDFVELARVLDTFAAERVAAEETEWARYDETIRDQGRAAAIEEAAKVAEQFSFSEPRLHPDVPWDCTAGPVKTGAHLASQLIAAAIRDLHSKGIVMLVRLAVGALLLAAVGLLTLVMIALAIHGTPACDDRLPWLGCKAISPMFHMKQKETPPRGGASPSLNAHQRLGRSPEPDPRDHLAIAGD